SLIILDEVGRGTSTYDGVSIAWAVSKYINNPAKIGARTLFATHYHELTGLEEEFDGIKNYNVLVEEDEKGVRFLHKIIPGRASESYGIEVARLAGLPQEIIINAQKLLNKLEEDNNINGINAKIDDVNKNNHSKVNENCLENNRKRDNKQLPLFPEPDPVVEKIINEDILDMTPMEAMNFIYELKKELKEREE
ncbi:MAG: MutS-related protein, partial [Bacillota bacterium]